MSERLKLILEMLKEDTRGKLEWEHVDGYDVEQINLILEYIENLQKKIENLKSKLWQIKELKHEWQDIEENTTLVFENNNLIDFMNKLERLLKLEKENN